MPGEIQRRNIGEPETIQGADGIVHKVQFELGQEDGQDGKVAILVAEETKDSPAHARNPDGTISISDAPTRDVPSVVVINPDNPAEIQYAIENIRKQIRGY